MSGCTMRVGHARAQFPQRMHSPRKSTSDRAEGGLIFLVATVAACRANPAQTAPNSAAIAVRRASGQQSGAAAASPNIASWPTIALSPTTTCCGPARSVDLLEAQWEISAEPAAGGMSLRAMRITATRPAITAFGNCCTELRSRQRSSWVAPRGHNRAHHRPGSNTLSRHTAGRASAAYIAPVEAGLVKSPKKAASIANGSANNSSG